MTKENTSLQVIEGMLSELQVAPSVENLLERIDKNYREKSLLTGLAAVAGDLYGQASSSAMLAMYEGEYTENFLCLLNGKVLCGSFGGASKLPTDKKVKVLAEEIQQDVWVAKAILCEELGWLWIHEPIAHVAMHKSNFKWGFWLWFFGVIMTTLTMIAISGSLEKEIDGLLMLIPTSFLLVLGITMWPVGDGGKETTEEFRLLGFSRPERINLNNYRYGLVHIHELVHSDESEMSHRNIYCYKKAMDEGKISMTSQ